MHDSESTTKERICTLIEPKPFIPWREKWIARSLQIGQSKQILLSIPHPLSRARLWNPLPNHADHSEMRQLAPTVVHTQSETQLLGYASSPLSNSHSSLLLQLFCLSFCCVETERGTLQLEPHH
jgi:hypothetical protein